MDKIRMVMKTDLSTKFHQLGFWMLLSALVGLILGSFYSENITNKRLSDSATYKVIKIDGKEYDLKEKF
jgi:uncharacterized membrane protein affecting hemolysin expression